MGNGMLNTHPEISVVRINLMSWATRVLAKSSRHVLQRSHIDDMADAIGTGIHIKAYIVLPDADHGPALGS